MTNQQFKDGLNAQLPADYQRVKSVSENAQMQTVLFFENQVDQYLENWLNNRFRYGVTLSQCKQRVLINRPKQ